MKKSKNALLICGLSLLSAIVLMLGVTFAWFAKDVINEDNHIDAGSLEVDFKVYEEDGQGGGGYVSLKGRDDSIFAVANDGKSVIRWEPGRSEILYLAVENIGNLALDYNVSLKIVENTGLIGAMEIAVLPGVTNTNIAEVAESWADIEADPEITVTQLVDGTNKIFAEDQRLLTTDGQDVVYFALVVHMNEEADNGFMGKGIVFDVCLVAKQAPVEEDGFGSGDYDTDADYE